jgi:hypothetical protein
MFISYREWSVAQRRLASCRMGYGGVLGRIGCRRRRRGGEPQRSGGESAGMKKEGRSDEGRSSGLLAEREDGGWKYGSLGRGGER